MPKLLDEWLNRPDTPLEQQRTVNVRVTSRPGHHVVALEAAAALMTLPVSLVDEADALREWRNRKYQGFFSAGERDVEDAIDAARRYLEATSLWLQQNQSHLLK